MFSPATLPVFALVARPVFYWSLRDKKAEAESPIPRTQSERRIWKPVEQLVENWRRSITSSSARLGPKCLPAWITNNEKFSFLPVFYKLSTGFHLALSNQLQGICAGTSRDVGALQRSILPCSGNASAFAARAEYYCRLLQLAKDLVGWHAPLFPSVHYLSNPDFYKFPPTETSAFSQVLS